MFEKRFTDMTDEEVNGMSLQEYEIHKEKNKQHNAWYVAKVIKGRIHDAPVLSEYITFIVSDKPDAACSSLIKNCCMSIPRKTVSRLKKAFLA